MVPGIEIVFQLTCTTKLGELCDGWKTEEPGIEEDFSVLEKCSDQVWGTKVSYPAVRAGPFIGG
jgi:hypothetical protein